MSADADPVAQRLIALDAGKVSRAASLGPLTTLKVGGTARALVVVERPSQLVSVGQVCREFGLEWLVVGRGSNLLISDHGFDGIAIQLGRGFRHIEVARTQMTIGAATPLPTVAMHSAQSGLAGMAWVVAVPGSLGGAVRMNAGAHGAEMADHLVSVDTVDLHTGMPRQWRADEVNFGYRSTDLPASCVVTSATVQLQPGDPATIEHDIREIRAWRRDHQPLNEPNCGSVFVNPEGQSAGSLIEAAGCKGLQVGGAQVSHRHANFIVTKPGATAADVVAVIAEVRRRVHAASGVQLRTEVVIVGDTSLSPSSDG